MSDRSQRAKHLGARALTNRRGRIPVVIFVYVWRRRFISWSSNSGRGPLRSNVQLTIWYYAPRLRFERIPRRVPLTSSPGEKEKQCCYQDEQGSTYPTTDDSADIELRRLTGGFRARFAGGFRARISSWLGFRERWKSWHLRQGVKFGGVCDVVKNERQASCRICDCDAKSMRGVCIEVGC